MSRINKGYHCWITNKTNRRIVIGDLRFVLKPYQTIDILDDRHSRYSVIEVEESINNGSLSKRRRQDFILIRSSEPKNNPYTKKYELAETSFPYKQRTLIDIKETYYDELDVDFSDEEFANENASTAGNERETFLGKKE